MISNYNGRIFGDYEKVAVNPLPSASRKFLSGHISIRNIMMCACMNMNFKTFINLKTVTNLKYQI